MNPIPCDHCPKHQRCLLLNQLQQLDSHSKQEKSERSQVRECADHRFAPTLELYKSRSSHQQHFAWEEFAHTATCGRVGQHQAQVAA